MNLYNLVLGMYDFLVELVFVFQAKIHMFRSFNFTIFLIIVVVVGQVVAIIIIMNLNNTR